MFFVEHTLCALCSSHPTNSASFATHTLLAVCVCVCKRVHMMSYRLSVGTDSKYKHKIMTMIFYGSLARTYLIACADIATALNNVFGVRLRIVSIVAPFALRRNLNRS